jgi:hypothetical protein
MMKPRPYQSSAVEALRLALARGESQPIYVSAETKPAAEKVTIRRIRCRPPVFVVEVTS